MKLTFLGTGTSTGVPQMRCTCPVCCSSDSRDKRLRASALIQPGHGKANILIDCGPDFRRQMLTAGCPDIGAVLLTHTHYDHVGGIDDLRPYSYAAPGHRFPVYCRADVAADLRARIPYCFTEHPYLGVPQFDLSIVSEGEVFTAADTVVEALPIIHGKLPILGYRIGNLAYITDASVVPPATIEAIRGIDTLVLNALHIEKHPSHLNLSQALNVIKETAPRCAYLTHMSHHMGTHAQASALLPGGVAFAYDGLTIDIDD